MSAEIAAEKREYCCYKFLVEGVRSINEAVMKGWHIKAFIFGNGKRSTWADKIPRMVHTDMNYCLTRELMTELSEKTDTSGLMAVIEIKNNTLFDKSISENPFIILSDRPSKFQMIVFYGNLYQI